MNKPEKIAAPAAASRPATTANPAAPVVPVPPGAGGRVPGDDLSETSAVADILYGRNAGGKDAIKGKDADAASKAPADGLDDSGEAQARHGETQGPGDGEAVGDAEDADEDLDDEGDDKGDGGDDEDVEAQAIYATKVKMQDGTELTVGELKDHFQQRAVAALEMTERENKVAAEHIELERIVKFFDAIPGPIKYRVAQEYDQLCRREAAACLEIFPSWRDEKARQAAHTDIMELAKEYGREAAIRAELMNPTDRMVIKILADYASLRRQVKTARERLRQATPTEKPAAKRVAPPQAKSRQQDLAARARKTGRDADETSAVASLL